MRGIDGFSEEEFPHIEVLEDELPDMLVAGQYLEIPGLVDILGAAKQVEVRLFPDDTAPPTDTV